MKRYFKISLIIMAAVLALPAHALAGPYRVERGDKLHIIAATHGTTVEDILAANPSIKRADMIFAGATIEIPGAEQAYAYDTYTVQRGDCLYDIAAAHGVSMQEIQRLTPEISDPSLLFVGQTLNIPAPAQGAVPAAPPAAAAQPDDDTSAGDAAAGGVDTAADISAMEREVLELVNAERAKAGVSPLEWDAKVAQLARAKSEDMAGSGQLSHTSGQLGSPFKMLRENGIDYKAASENIARGQQTAQEVVEMWMASTGHRESILNPNFTHMGAGMATDPDARPYWTQLLFFLGKEK